MKILKVFGPQVKSSVAVIISHAEAVKHKPYAINNRTAECQNLGVPCMVWESKEITPEDKILQIKDFFEMVKEDLIPYQILQLNDLDKELRQAARDL